MRLPIAGRRVSTLWKANAIVFISSFCVMVIELIAARLLAPHIGVSLYTWTSIIGVILASIAIGNYLGGRIADRYASHVVLVLIFLAGSLATVAILPAVKIVTGLDLFSGMPPMINFTLKTACIFFVPAFILSMVSPLVIKLTLEDLGRTGGVVGTIYAVSTAGAILGTFMTGFFFILWFGLRMIVWLVAIVLFLAGVLAWFSWKSPRRWALSSANIILWMITVIIILGGVVVFQLRDRWQETYTKESNYYSIQVNTVDGKMKALSLDHLLHAYVVVDDPKDLKYNYLNTFEQIVKYVNKDGRPFKSLHLGGGGYSLPRYFEAVYPGSVNDVVEIDPAVTEVVYQELGLPRNTTIQTNNMDARQFFIQRKTNTRYDFVVGDVFNDFSTPYHLTTLEFDRMIKANMEKDGIYLVNIIDSYTRGRYMASTIRTLKQVFQNVYLFNTTPNWDFSGPATYVLAATDRTIDLADFRKFNDRNEKGANAFALDEAKLAEYVASRDALILTDEYAPTDILLAQIK
ncbi:MAG: fused MFS/spermidine synthase [Dehalococcoidia bacterium]|nr:fused MFS/spermidine synthase [Dehalococcoidia bacterium]